MTVGARFVHVNLIAQDWKKLARFYERVFGCTLIPPERRLAGEWLAASTGVPDAQIQGAHLRLPGCGNEGPTLEIFQYDQQKTRPPTAINRPGFAHIAFTVEDVEATLDAVLAAGGSTVGQVVTLEVPYAGTITFVYAADPEGNILELQNWSG